MKYPEYKQLNLPLLAKEMLTFWEKEKIFDKSISSRAGAVPFVFYEGPPSANGLPGIHHVMARTIKDLFCRYHTLKGKQVHRKAGWDTHGLPIELAVEKTLGVTKEDIGKKISIEEYNKACRKEVMKYTDRWEELTRKMGYWVDMQHPYITYDNKYIESVWWLLKNLYNKQLLYKGYTIQPYSPAAGTGLSTHELNQPGCYRNVKDTSVIAMFKAQHATSITRNEAGEDTYFLAWTTTPWTLPSNCALAVGKDITYVLVKTYNPYSYQPVKVILAKDLAGHYFPEKNAGLLLEEYKPGDKNIPFKFLTEVKGADLIGIRYEQLLPFVKPAGKAFEVISGDFVTTDEGTGIVHTASVFGADDFRVCQQHGISSVLVKDEHGHDTPLVDKRGKFVKELYDADWGFAGEYVKQEYLTGEEKEKEYQTQKERLKKYIPNLKEYLSVDERIALKLKLEGKAFKIEKYEHSYPHCWRTDKPILYYPLDSWFVKVTEKRERMVALNKTIKWKPEATGSGRFGNWLENANDWNLSRSRFWGIPLPIWRTEDGKEELCIGSVQQLQEEINKAVTAGFMKSNPLAHFKSGDFSQDNYNCFDLHKPYADELILVAPSGRKMFRENDLIDVWFDSGAMPYAQLHYPFENKEKIDTGEAFPADFIAEGVDQTRGWFYTLHAIATLCFDSVAYKNVVSNGLVLDKNGNKMSKRLGNAADPFETLEKYGSDATRWYMITNAQPWDNLKFDSDGIAEVQRKFFGTLYNTYAFFALYANIDEFRYKEPEIPFQERTEIDRWILSELQTLVKKTDAYYSNYEPTLAGRLMEDFVDNLSNWYVRLCRRRFWKGEYSKDKIAAYQTLYRCLEVMAQLISPIAPFFADRLFLDLNRVTGHIPVESVHLSTFPVALELEIDSALEERMNYARRISSLVLSIRKKENIRVRQPLNKIQIPVTVESFKKQVDLVRELILAEVNVKELEFVTADNTRIVKNLKLNFKTLGKKCGKLMKTLQAYALANASSIIAAMESAGTCTVELEGEPIILLAEDVEIIPVDIPGWKVANEGPLTVALDITITPGLKEEGIARELVNRIQNLRKEKNLEVTDKIAIKIQEHQAINEAIHNNLAYICSEILASSLEMVSRLEPANSVEVEVDDHIKTFLTINKQ